MTNQETIDLIKRTFDKIESSLTTKEVEEILRWPVVSKNVMNERSYPKIEFKIDKDEIAELKVNNYLNTDNSISTLIGRTPMNALTKLLYAVSWKNGDLTKIRHIVEGILADEIDKKENKKSGLVFYQFGKYLTKKPGEPIIDQHVLRAFGIYRLEKIEDILPLRKLAVITKNEESLINEYKTWLRSPALKDELKKELDYTYYIDKVLFAVGKTIKSRRR
jgi:hypothetical protein